MRRKDPGRLGAVSDGLILRWGKGGAARSAAVRDALRETLGKEAAGRVRPAGFKKGVLTISVENPSWLYKLTLDREEILRKFNENYGGRKKAVKIRFRIGVHEEW
ncbi:MAG: DUF721 domain-containing protein [Candidatus Omnitrophota bacterium]